MQFLHQPLTWAFLLLLAPPLIHMINLMRHQRVRWAAMDFLLQSHRKHRNWIRLKQLLLLLMRMAIIGAAVAMLAQLVSQHQWFHFLGGTTVHHLVLVDDSLSMTDRSGDTTAFEQALRTVKQIAARAGAIQEQRQEMTLLRFSRAEHAPPPSSADASAPDGDMAEGTPLAAVELPATVLGRDFDSRLEDQLRMWEASELASEPTAALQMAQEIVTQQTDRQTRVYVLSDFRRHPWSTPAQLQPLLDPLIKAGATVHLVRCTAAQHANLAVTSLQTVEGPTAAGVPFFVDVQVKNFGAEVAQQIPLKIQTITHAAPADMDPTRPASPETTDLPTVLLERLEPGETLTRRVQVLFSQPGEQIIRAELPEDAIAADNSRMCVVSLLSTIPVLAIDGSSDGQHAYYLQSVFQPSQRAQTGVRVTVQSTDFLRQLNAADLAEYHTVYLLDVDRVDPAARSVLLQYVQQGGGLAVFLGPDAHLPSYQEWYGEGEGLFPLLLDREEELPAADSPTPDLIVTDHPLFRGLLGERNPFATGIRVERYMRPVSGWKPPARSTTQVLARLRNGDPLMLERRVGAGRVVACLTTLAPLWNNWAREPSFVVVMLQLHAYLDAPRGDIPARLVGTPIELSLDSTRYLPEVQFWLPRRLEGPPRSMTRQGVPVPAGVDPAGPLANTPSAPDRQPTPDRTTGSPTEKYFTVSLGGPRDKAYLPTETQGIYEARPVRTDGQMEFHRYALNVDTRESDLALLDKRELAEQLQPIEVHVHDPEELDTSADAIPGFPWSQALLSGLVLLLIGEQLLGYSASYHKAARGYDGSPSARVGGVPPRAASTRRAASSPFVGSGRGER